MEPIHVLENERRCFCSGGWLTTQILDQKFGMLVSIKREQRCQLYDGQINHILLLYIMHVFD